MCSKLDNSFKSCRNLPSAITYTRKKSRPNNKSGLNWQGIFLRNKMLQHNLYFIYLKQNKKQNKTQLSLLSQKDLDSGILTSAVLSFTLVHSSCAAIPFLTEHVPPWPCAAWHAALKEGRHVLVWLHEAVLMILWLEADLGTSFLGPGVHACTNCHLSYVDKWSRTNPWNWKPHCCARFIPFSYHVLCFKPPLFTLSLLGTVWIWSNGRLQPGHLPLLPFSAVLLQGGWVGPPHSQNPTSYKAGFLEEHAADGYVL